MCVDLKIVNFICGQQCGYTKHPITEQKINTVLKRVAFTRKTEGNQRTLFVRKNIYYHPCILRCGLANNL